MTAETVAVSLADLRALLAWIDEACPPHRHLASGWGDKRVTYSLDCPRCRLQDACEPIRRKVEAADA